MGKKYEYSVGPLRAWLGSGLVAVAGISHPALAAICPEAPIVVLSISIGITLLGSFLCVPLRRSPIPTADKESESSFIVGNVTGSKIKNIDTDAGTFVKGDVVDTTIAGVVMRRFRRKS